MDVLTDKQKNPKAFAINSVQSAARKFRRKEELTAKKQHIPIVDKTPDEPPPFLVAVVGPPKVGKSTLIGNLIKSFTRTNVTSINGPITLVTSKKRRITLIECNNDVNSMIDIAKCADLVLLMVDASFGFEMEIFEFLNICQVHGMPKIMGVLTHLDMIKNPNTLKRRKKELKHRFWTEVYNGAKLFQLSGILRGEYLRNEIKNLCRFISVMKFRPLTWRGAHSYILADRMEDLTNVETIRRNPKCDRDVCLYGYVRGVPLNKEFMVHIAGLGDVRIDELSHLSDPCPLPGAEKKRNLLEKERLLYAPMSGVGGIVYDKDAVYIELQGSHSHTLNEEEEDPERAEIIGQLKRNTETVDEKIERQEMKLFSDGFGIQSNQFKGADEDEEEDDALFEDSDEEEGDEDDSGMEEDETEKTSSGLGWRGDSDGEQEERENEDGDKSSDDEEYDENVVDGEGDAEEGEDDDEEEEEAAPKWREGLAEKARNDYLERQKNSKSLMKIVYGMFSEARSKLEARRQQEAADEDAEEQLGGLFKISKAQSERQKERQVKDQNESCFFETYVTGRRDWMTQKEKLRNCFVTGKWKASEDAEELLKLDDMSDNESEVFGDFEDLETGEVHKAEGENAEEEGDDDEKEDEEEEEEAVNPPKRQKLSRTDEANLSREELMAKKMKLKAKFDSEYDNPEKSERITGDHQFYDNWMAETQRQSQMNKKEFATLDESLRVQIEGFRAGMYVRMLFRGLPSEFVTEFDAKYPTLIGGLNMIEENVGYVSCKVKKHRWYKKILKTADPLIISLGWRRFQSCPVYAKVEDNMRQRYLKYTPNHVTCSMTFWGPITPQNTGFLAIQSVAQDQAEMRRIGFRIAATGCVTEIDKSAQIMKKLKLVGVPHQIKKNTAFIKDMFNSALEATKFKGAKIRTVSGIRGEIKKPERTPKGAVRCTFENKILMSGEFCFFWVLLWILFNIFLFLQTLCSAGRGTRWTCPGSMRQ